MMRMFNTELPAKGSMDGNNEDCKSEKLIIPPDGRGDCAPPVGATHYRQENSHQPRSAKTPLASPPPIPSNRPKRIPIRFVNPDWNGARRLATRLKPQPNRTSTKAGCGPQNMTKIEQARAYIKKAPLAISGQGGDNTTFKVACRLVQGFALSGDEALELMDEYNDRLDERWMRHQLKHKVECAMNSPSHYPLGYALDPSAPYKPTPPAPPPKVTVWKINPKPLPVKGQPPLESQQHGIEPSSSTQNCF